MSFSAWPGYRPGHRWVIDERADRPPRARFVRPLGVLEAKFDDASQRQGQSDTFLRLKVSLPASVDDGDVQCAFVARLSLAWANLRASHPLLATTVRDAPHVETIPMCRTREFQYEPPASTEDALRRAQKTILKVDAAASQLDAAMDDLQGQHILNGERVLLDQSTMARLVLVVEQDPTELGFFLLISHIISDGLSVFRLVNELFSLVASPDLPTPATSPHLLTVDAFLAGSRDSPAWEVPGVVARPWVSMPPPDEVLRRLPLATEDHFPNIPLSSSVHSSSTPQPTEAPADTEPHLSAPHAPPSAARQRWFWAITRILILLRQRRFPRSLHFPRLAYPSPPVQANTRWPFLRFNKASSASMIRFCKRNSLSPSMLLYAILSMSLANAFAKIHPHEPYRPVLIGFPFSARPFLEPVATPSSDPSSDCAIRITFGTIHLPNIPQDPTVENREAVRATALRGARLAKQQFTKRLAPERQSRSLFLASAYALILDRLLSSTGRNPIPYEDPKTAINASMIGDVDRLLPTTFSFPPSTASHLRLHEMLVGTRLHRREGMLMETFTWDGMIQVCLGVDDKLIRDEHVEGILEGMRRIGEVIAGSESAQQ
ncbi:hypothetical protein JCM21900_003918 [Sporobolomyces salmonicolor]